MSIISDAIDLVARAKKLADELSSLDLKETIAELRGKLLDLKEEILTLREENTTFKAERAKLTLPPELTLKDDVYWKADGSGPLCVACHHKDHKLIPLTEQSGLLAKTGKWRCSVCKATFGPAKIPTAGAAWLG